MTGSPRILLISAEYPPTPGGVGDYTALLAQHLAADGAAVAVLTTGDGAARRDGAVAVHAAVPRWDWGCAHGVYRLMRQTEAEIVHLQYQTGMYAMHPAINLLPLRLGWRDAVPHLVQRGSRDRARTRFVTTFHDIRAPYLFPKAGPVRPLVSCLLARASDTAIATNGADASVLRRWGANTALIPIGSNIPTAAPMARGEMEARFGVPRAALLLTTFGLLNHSKGVDQAIDALAQVRAGGIDAHLLLVGAGIGANDPTNMATEERIAALCAACGVAHHVSRTGTLAAPEIAAVLAASDVCVQPYRDGASPRRGSLLAAFAQGVPVVTTIPHAGVYDGLPEPRGGETALFVPPDDPAALANAVRHIPRDGALAARLGANACAFAARFDWPTIARLHVALYDTLISPRQTAHATPPMGIAPGGER